MCMLCITIVLACMIITGFLYIYVCNALYMSAVLIPVSLNQVITVPL